MKYFYLLLSSALLLLGQFHTTDAATIGLYGDFETLHVGDILSVAVRVDTEKESLNAIESTLIFPPSLLEYQTSDDSDSVLSLWLERPSLVDSSKIHFSGMTPLGFISTKAPIVTLYFKVISMGKASIELSDTSLLINDGLGTKAVTKVKAENITVSPGVSSLTLPTVNDDEIPEYFEPQMITDPDVFLGRPALIFSTTDKGSGLDHFEIQEGFWGQFKTATSPYEIKDTSLKSRIAVKAIDRLGNYRLVQFYPPHFVPWYQDVKILATMLVVGTLLVLVFKKLFMRLRRKYS